MSDALELSPIQQKEIEAEKAKQAEEKRQKFIKAIEVVQDEHKLKVQAVINFNITGITPQLVIVPIEEKKDEVSSTG